MQKMRVTVTFVIVLFAMIALQACGDDQKEPSNCITDGKGLSIDLAWTTGSSIPAALHEADLDLDVYKGDVEILSSYNAAEFEHVDLTHLFEDGIYTVRLSLHEISKTSEYTLKMSGAAHGKTFSTSGFFKADDLQSAVSVFRITKVGEQFKLSAL